MTEDWYVEIRYKSSQCPLRLITEVGVICLVNPKERNLCTLENCPRSRLDLEQYPLKSKP